MSAAAPGMLDTRIALLRPSAALDELGAPLGFAPAGFAWAKLESIGAASANEPFLGQGRARVRLLMRHPQSLAQGWRVLIGAKVFEVQTILAGSVRTGFIEIECAELAP